MVDYKHTTKHSQLLCFSFTYMYNMIRDINIFSVNFLNFNPKLSVTESKLKLMFHYSERCPMLVMLFQSRVHYKNTHSVHCNDVWTAMFKGPKKELNYELPLSYHSSLLYHFYSIHFLNEILINCSDMKLLLKLWKHKPPKTYYS